MNSPHVVDAQTAIRVTLENIGNLQDYNGYYNGKLLTITPQVTSGNNNLTMEAKDYSHQPIIRQDTSGNQERCMSHGFDMNVLISFGNVARSTQEKNENGLVPISCF